MTTSLFVSPIDSDTDVNFRAWGSQLSAQLAAVGLTQTADTGQVNWSTVTVAYSSSVAAGYEIWRFNDGLQGSAPIFLKLEYGASSAQQARLWLTVGTSSDGAGNITGSVQYQRTAINSPTASTNGTPYTTYLCYNATLGFLGLSFKSNLTVSYGGFSLAIFRSNDTTGAPTALGATVLTAFGGQCASLQMCFAANNTIPPGGVPSSVAGLLNVPYSLATTGVGGNFQVMPIIVPYRLLSAQAAVCGGLLADLPLGTTFNLNVVGSTVLTFISAGGFGSLYKDGSTGGTLCMLWQ